MSIFNPKPFVVYGKPKYPAVLQQEVRCDNPRHAVATFIAAHTDYRPEAVSQLGTEEYWDVIGTCVACQTPVLDDEAYARQDDGLVLCAKCVQTCQRVEEARAAKQKENT